MVDSLGTFNSPSKSSFKDTSKSSISGSGDNKKSASKTLLVSTTTTGIAGSSTLSQLKSARKNGSKRGAMTASALPLVAAVPVQETMKRPSPPVKISIQSSIHYLRDLKSDPMYAIEEPLAVYKHVVVDFNSRNNEGQNVLHVACLYGKFDMVKLLLKKFGSSQFDVNATDFKGNTCMDLAWSWLIHLNCVRKTMPNQVMKNSADDGELNLVYKYFLKNVKYSTAKFTIFYVNSREFTNFHTFSRNLFFTGHHHHQSAANSMQSAANSFYRYGQQTKLNIASHGLFHKNSFIFPIRGGNMDCFEYERFFVKKPMRGYF
jgi:hypothetical protein